MGINEIRQKYFDFFEKRGHVLIPSASLVPENDPTTLFTGSGMQPLLPYLLGEQHPKGSRLVDSQKCFRAEDIEEVGDNRHTTFFEMLGNWSLGDYWKEEQLSWFFEFLTKEIGIPTDNLWVTCFEGDQILGLSRDEESAAIWRKLGIPEERIRFYDAKKNWWSRAGEPGKMPVGEPGGPDSEVFYEFTSVEHNPEYGEKCHPNCDCGRFMEIGNSVFMQYIKKEDGSFEPLPQKNVDFGGGLERIAAASNDNPDVFAMDVFSPLFDYIDSYHGIPYRESDETQRRALRIIADHLRAAIFLIHDGVLPSNTDQGYLLRRLLRRATRYAKLVGIGRVRGLHTYIETVYLGNDYITIRDSQHDIDRVIAEEEEKFERTLEKGLKEFERMVKGSISGHEAFALFSTYGFPLELTLELALERGISVDEEGFQEEMKKHQELSRAGAEQKFKGGLADHSEKVVQYHTATHLLLAGLRKELGPDVHQAGSNITAERTRFDFTYPEKVSRDVLDRVERYVNDAIQNNATVTIERMKKEDAKNNPEVEGSFWEKYPDEVNVYSVVGEDGTVYSKELCGGPHVENTKGMGTFKITREEASSAGVRRIKAVLE